MIYNNCYVDIVFSLPRVILTPILVQKHPLRERFYQRSAVVLSVALRTNPANSAVALVVVLGSRSVEMPVIQNPNIHGRRASMPVKVTL